MTDAAASSAPAAAAPASAPSTPATPTSTSTATPAATSAAPAATTTAAPSPAAAATPVATTTPWVPTIPQGSPLDVGYVKSVADLAAAKGIPAEQAQAFLEFQHTQALAHIQQAQTERTAWEAELKADPKIGGDKFDATIKEVDRSLDKLFGPQANSFREILKNTGYGSNPTVVRALAHAASLLRDDSFNPGAATGGKPSEEQLLALRYPTMAAG